MKKVIAIVIAIVAIVGMTVMSGCSTAAVRDIGDQYDWYKYDVPVITVEPTGQTSAISSGGIWLPEKFWVSYADRNEEQEPQLLQAVNSGVRNLLSVTTRYTENGSLYEFSYTYFENKNDNDGRGTKLRLEIIRGNHPEDVQGKDNELSLESKVEAEQRRLGKKSEVEWVYGNFAWKEHKVAALLYYYEE